MGKLAELWKVHKGTLLGEADLYFDVVVLCIAGMALTMTGLLLFPVSVGFLPYYENGVYGLLLFLFGLQTVLLGRTPAGDFKRSLPVVAGGAAIATVGILACFIPDVFTLLPRMILILCLGLGGFLQLLQMLFSRDKLQAWLRYGGIFPYLAPACGAVYIFSIFAGLLVWEKGLLSVRTTALSVLVYGTSVFALAFLLQKIYRRHPKAAAALVDDFGLSADRSMLLLTGIFMVVLGVLLVPVTFGNLPFSGSAQLGLLMVIFAVQMLAFGSTPIGAFRRTWFMILLGFAFAALGIISCVVPLILVPSLTLLVGLLNLAGGGSGLAKIIVPLVKDHKDEAPVPSIIVRLTITQVFMNLVSILFGASMLASGLLPGWVVGIMLAANGGLLLYLMRILMQIDKMKSAIIEETA